MDIRSAILARTAEKPYITREAWKYLTEHPVSSAVKILPTDSPDCCIILSETTKTKAPCPRWQPMAEDLVAEDWIITR